MRNERFATSREIKDHLVKLSESNGGGPILWVDPETKEIYVLDSESNLIFFGVSGAGKTRRGIVSMILSWISKGQCFIVVDPKGDLYYLTYCFAKDAGYEIYSLNFRDIEKSHGVNILYDPYMNYKKGNIEQANQAIQTITHSLIKHSNDTDPFWPDSARSLVEGVIYILFERGRPDQINMRSVFSMISAGFERIGPKRALDVICEEDPDSVASLLLQNTLTTSSDTLGGIRSVAFENLSCFVKSPALIDMLSTNEMSISSLDVEKPTAVYLITPDENSNFSAITSILVSQIAEHYIQLAHEKYNGRLKRTVNICVEELGNLGENGIPNLAHLMSAGRSRNVKTSIVLQSFSQLQDCYGKSQAEIITANADTIIAYRTNQWETLEELSRKCGERAVEYGNRVEVERLIQPSQIGQMETGRVLILASGRLKYSTVLPDFTEIFSMDKWYPPQEVKHKRTKANTFDIKNEAMSHRTRFAARKMNPFDEAALDDMIARIDARIAELQEDEVPEPKTTYNVIVTSNEKCAGKIAGIVASRSGKSADRIASKLKKQQLVSIDFEDLNEAKLFANTITCAGGYATIESEASNSEL